METRSQRPTEQDGVPSSLKVAIQDLDLARGLSGIPPATVAFGSVSALLGMIRVQHFSPFCNGRIRFHTHLLALDNQRTGLRRARVILCGCLQGA